MTYDVIVIGAGPSGVSAAMNLENKKVLLIDANEDILKKLSLSGGSRCNITNSDDADEFDRKIENNKFFISTLNNFDNYALKDFIESIGVELKLEGKKYFPTTDKATTIVEALRKKLKNVDIRLKCKVFNVDKGESQFNVNTTAGVFNSERVIIASGAKTYKELGATEFAYKMAKHFGHTINELYPTNCSLRTAEKAYLAGTPAGDVTVTFNGKTCRGEVLFTHFGVTGPAIFEVTSKNCFKGKIKINFTNKDPKEFEKELIAHFSSSKDFVKTYLKKFIPKKFAEYGFKKVMDRKCSELKKEQMVNIADKLSAFEFNVKDFYSFDRAFTTGGGIPLKEIDPKSFESKKMKGLHFIGECLDYFAPTGGYNLTLCFSQGYSVAKYILEN